MLWDSIRDFFVQHVFGGYTSFGRFFEPYVGWLGGVYDDEFYTSNMFFQVGKYEISIGDYLSTTATIISISIIVVLCCLFVYKIIKLIGGLIR